MMPALSKVPMAASFAATLLMFLAFSNASAEPVSGEAIYQKCVNCHGMAGHGVKRFWAPGIAGLQAEYVERQLNNFYDQVRGYAFKDVGGHRMRPMARMLKKGQTDQKSAEMIKAVSEYISKLPPSIPKETLSNADSDRGGQIYAKVCRACHAVNAGGIVGLGPDLRYSGDWYLFTQLKNFKEKRRAGLNDPDCKKLVPPAKCDPKGMEMVAKVWPKDGTSVLPDDQSMKDVIAYITRISRDTTTK
jgi:cytochrome c553